VPSDTAAIIVASMSAAVWLTVAAGAEWARRGPSRRQAEQAKELHEARLEADAANARYAEEAALRARVRGPTPQEIRRGVMGELPSLPMVPEAGEQHASPLACFAIRSARDTSAALRDEQQRVRRRSVAATSREVGRCRDASRWRASAHVGNPVLGTTMSPKRSVRPSVWCRAVSAAATASRWS
jgi:hypothetical protein